MQECKSHIPLADILQWTNGLCLFTDLHYCKSVQTTLDYVCGCYL